MTIVEESDLLMISALLSRMDLQNVDQMKQ